ncbi:GlxA family transcriptional regulator, partial [Pseudomonas aeruginosa]|nr:GlxA family transcriptional regulator [Pseudomonas aeruginosa]
MERRRFSAALQGQNLRFTGAGEGGSARARVLSLIHISEPTRH